MFNYKEEKMTSTYSIDVDCAACADKMENAARKTAGVKSCTVNFMMQRMIVEFEEGADKDQVMKSVRKNCRRVDSDAEIFI